jgi:NAD(P)H-quinone oxidoreductase subunit 5
MLHLVAHSLYKAHAFLASGSGVDAFRAPTIVTRNGDFRFGRLLIALVTGLSMTVSVGAVFGITPESQPSLIATGSIVAIAITQLLLQTASVMDNGLFLLRGLGLGALVCTIYFSLHSLFDIALHDSVLPIQNTTGPFQKVLALVVVGIFLALLMLQKLLKYAPASWIDGLYMHLYNGLYIDVYITRLLQRVWPSPTPIQGNLSTPFATERSHKG